MTVYVIGNITINDQIRWAEYRDQVPATLVPWKGEVVLRGSGAALLDGEHRHTDTVVLRFPDMASAKQWHESPAYQALVPLRRQAAEVDLVSFEADL
jgi:uncharacterized protein (DUF1330 family)